MLFNFNIVNSYFPNTKKTMAKIIHQRMTVQMDGDFVVFLIGMRINRFWRIHKWIPILSAMPKMLIELSKNPDSGFLGYQMSGGIQPVLIQYWKSFEHLEAYAKDINSTHYPIWKAYNQKIKGNEDVGIWHETYKVRSGEYECIYNNMPKYGLGKVGDLIPVTGKREHAADRISNGRK
jgi:hypothetical protein